MSSFVGPGTDTTALPVAVLAAGPHADAIRAWVEGVLGWQAVDAGADPLVPAVARLLDLDADAPPQAGDGASLAGDVPTVLLVDDDADTPHVGEVAARIGPDAVLGWPSGRDRLEAVVGDLLARRNASTGATRVLRVGGSAGGVGTTTVALALAGLAAWSGLRSFVAIRGTGLAPRAVPAAALAAPDLWARADPIVGVAALRGVVIADRAEVPNVTDGAVDAVVLDAGVHADADVLVCRPDAAALAVLPTTTAAAVVLVGEGPVSARDLARVAAGRTGVRVPWSARVARASVQGRIPAGLPGAWLARLEPLAPRAEGARRRGRGTARFDDPTPPAGRSGSGRRRRTG